ncbi:MAG: hypothetical protein QG657_1295 [Acidobacteriota bacterium]|nr:hypothetical protein [Acidobacteriota bacterium]
MFSPLIIEESYCVIYSTCGECSASACVPENSPFIVLLVHNPD